MGRISMGPGSYPPTVTIDVDMLLTLLEAARAALDRLDDREQHQRLAAAVQHANDLAHAVMLVEWQELRSELRRRRVPLRACQTASAVCPPP
jgi:hypothetical protein